MPQPIAAKISNHNDKPFNFKPAPITAGDILRDKAHQRGNSGINGGSLNTSVDSNNGHQNLGYPYNHKYKYNYKTYEPVLDQKKRGGPKVQSPNHNHPHESPNTNPYPINMTTHEIYHRPLLDEPVNPPAAKNGKMATENSIKKAKNLPMNPQNAGTDVDSTLNRMYEKRNQIREEMMLLNLDKFVSVFANVSALYFFDNKWCAFEKIKSNFLAMKKNQDAAEKWCRKRLLKGFFGVMKGLVRETRLQRKTEIQNNRTEAMTRQYNLASSFYDFTL
jgi:hypothetical protein